MLSARLCHHWRVLGSRLQHLPAPLIASGVALVLAAITGGMVSGTPAAVGAAVGVAIVAVGFTLSVFVIAWADSINPKLVLPFGMGVYLIKIIWLGMAFLVLSSNQWPGNRAVGIGIMVGVVCWTAGQIWTVVRTGPHSRRARAAEAAAMSPGSAVSSQASQE